MSDTYKQACRTCGFTLIEMSIVLVIISLIVGGIVVGQQLMQAAQIQKTASQSKQYITAVRQFKAKYNCLPGDCPSYKATQFNFPYNTGNGDNMITICCTFSIFRESAAAFPHLAYAGLIDGNSFSTDMTNFGSMNYVVTGYNTPKPPIPLLSGPYTGSGWVIQYAATPSGSFNTLLLEHYDGWNGTYGAGVLPIFAMMLDTKIDDGKPQTGRMQLANPSTAVISWTYPGSTAPGGRSCVAVSGGSYSYNVTAPGDLGRTEACRISIQLEN